MTEFININNQEINDKFPLENFLNSNTRVIIDTCSILEDNSEKFFKYAIPILQKNKSFLLIPKSCILEIEKHKNNKSNSKLATKAKLAYEIIARMQSENLVQLFADKDDSNLADNVILTVFMKYRMKYTMVLITQDTSLAQEVDNLNRSKAVSIQRGANRVFVFRINKNGLLQKFYFKNESSNTTNVDKQTIRNKGLDEKNSINPNQVFKICSRVTNLEDSKIVVSSYPTENSTLYTSLDKAHSIELKKQLASGGEGYIYETNTEFVAKIYKPENNTILKKAKIELLLSKDIRCQGICTPISALYNDNGVFVGYLMPKATGKELQRCVFLIPQLKKNFPNWKKIDLVKLCITILKKIKFLHDRNIILGDINPANILVSSPTEVYFVDTDSYQIEDLPCPVGTINYTAPEIQGKAYKTFLRTIGNEQFAVATLLFMIMLPGKTPYAQQGGESAEDNIKKMDFPYPFGDISNRKAPDGPWKFIWSHLPYELKQAFFCTFAAGQKYSSESKRLDDSRWLNIFKNYIHLFESGKLEEQDPMSLELFPTRHKNTSNNSHNIEYITCKLCGQKVQKKDSQKGICNSCLSPTKGEIYNCKICGKQLIYTNIERYIKGKDRYPYCDKCSAEPDRSVTCVSCGKKFYLSKAEVDSFNSKGLSLPKRCKDCRSKKNSQKSGSNSSSSSNSSGFGIFSLLSSINRW